MQFFADGEWRSPQELLHLRKELEASLDESEAGRAIKTEVLNNYFQKHKSLLELAERKRQEQELETRRDAEALQAIAARTAEARPAPAAPGGLDGRRRCGEASAAAHAL